MVNNSTDNPGIKVSTVQTGAGYVFQVAGKSTGAANDIEKAAALAGRMVCEWGMLPGSDEVYLFSQSQRDQAAQQWLSRGRLLAVETLRRYQGAWESLTELLLRRETVTGEDVAACLREADA